jgi:hypothetical protein
MDRRNGLPGPRRTQPKVPISSPRSRAEHLSDFSVDRHVLKITAWALPVGLASAGLAYALLRLIGLITNLVFYQQWNTHLVAPGIGIAHHPLVVLLAPVGGGLIVGLMARFGSERIRGHGMPEAIEAILVGESRIQPRVALLKPVSAAISIGTGGPFGAEGPIIMTGGATGSILAQYLHLSADERKTLLVRPAAWPRRSTRRSPRCCWPWSCCCSSGGRGASCRSSRRWRRARSPGARCSAPARSSPYRRCTCTCMRRSICCAR